MKVHRDFFYEIETLEKVEKLSKEKGISLSRAADELINSGWARNLEIESRYTKLAPDLSDLK